MKMFKIIYSLFFILISQNQLFSQSILDSFKTRSLFENNIKVSDFNFKYVKSDTIDLYFIYTIQLKDFDKNMKIVNEFFALKELNFGENSFYESILKSKFDYYYIPIISSSKKKRINDFPFSINYKDFRDSILKENQPLNNVKGYKIAERSVIYVFKINAQVEIITSNKIELGKYIYHFLPEKELNDLEEIVQYKLIKVFSSKRIKVPYLFGLDADYSIPILFNLKK